MRYAVSNPRMRPWQCVKGNGGVQMVLSMVGHIPHHKAHGPRGQCGARIGQTIGILTTPGMFGKRDCP